MFFKHLLIFLWLFGQICGEKSFTIVLDTSGSMGVELDIIKGNLATTLNAVGNTNIGDYIIVPFKDPGVADPIITLTPRELLAALNRISLSGGNDDDCPENSLAGIERALHISRPQSNIFLFTNAYAKDIDKLRSIENLCRNTRSKVVIFLTGFCKATSSVNVQAYFDVAKACSGTVFEINISVLRQVFQFIKELIKVEWTDVISYNTFTDYTNLSFSVDAFTKSALIVISGHCPSVIFSQNNTRVTFDNIMVSRYAQVVQLVNAPAGDYTMTCNCRGRTSVSLYRKNQLPVTIGFSTQRPRRMRETSRRPMPGTTNYLFIEFSNTFTLEYIAIQVFNEEEKKTMALEDCVENHCLAKSFVEPDKSFRIWIEGYDKITLKKIKGSTDSFIPQGVVIDPRWTAPKAEILEDTTVVVDYGNSATVACKVFGYPKPRIWWEDNETTLSGSTDGLLEIPNVYISYLNMENVTSNVTIYCKSKNSEGEDSQDIEVYVYRPFKFEVLQSPEDQDVEYGTESKLFCQVSAYPEAEIKWYYNDSLVSDSDGLEIIPDENALMIKEMKLNNVGDYKCEASNDMNTTTYTAYVTVTGIEAPQVEIESSNINLRLGDQSDIECRVIKGKPLPEITWKYKSERGVEFDSLPETVLVDEGKLQISSAQSEHNGVYRCYANNIQGEHSADVTINVQYPPTMTNNETTTLVVKEDDEVTLDCDVSASPAPTVWWEMAQDDVIVSLDTRHHTDENHKHRFKALGKDSGNYHCIAENEIGRARITVTVNVLVKPYIEAPRSTTVNIRSGADVTLPCNLVVGNPVPSIKWQFIALDSTNSVLKRNNSSTSLHIPAVRPADEGFYTCIADNTVGTDNIKYHVIVH